MHAPLTGHYKSILALAFSSIGSYFALGFQDRFICVWDAVAGEGVLPSIFHQGGSITSLIYMSDRNRIISAFDNHTIHVLDAHDSMLLYNPHETYNLLLSFSGVTKVTYSPSQYRPVASSSHQPLKTLPSTCGMSQLELNSPTSSNNTVSLSTVSHSHTTASGL